MIILGAFLSQSDVTKRHKNAVFSRSDFVATLVEDVKLTPGKLIKVSCCYLPSLSSNRETSRGDNVPPPPGRCAFNIKRCHLEDSVEVASHSFVNMKQRLRLVLQYFWRLNRAGHLMTRRPVEMGNFWEGLPDSTSVSAAYERPDGSVVFFCGE